MENNDHKTAFLIEKLDLAAKVVNDLKTAEAPEFQASCIMYAAFLTDYQNKKIAHNERSNEILAIIEEFADLMINLKKGVLV